MHWYVILMYTLLFYLACRRTMVSQPYDCPRDKFEIIDKPLDLNLYGSYHCLENIWRLRGPNLYGSYNCLENIWRLRGLTSTLHCHYKSDDRNPNSHFLSCLRALRPLYEPYGCSSACIMSVKSSTLVQFLVESWFSLFVDLSNVLRVDFRVKIKAHRW